MNHTMALQNDDIIQAVKEEVETNDAHNQDSDTILGIKTENDTIRTELPLNENPFENVQLQIKQEINFSLILEAENSNSLSADDNIITPNDVESNVNIKNSTTEQIVIKNEMQMDESEVCSDYPTFDDTVSMDSNEAAALGNVEACLQDEIDIKYENDAHYDENKKNAFHHNNVKIESDLTLSAAHQMDRGIEEMPKPKSLVIIHSVIRNNDANDKISNEEEILPTSYSSENEDLKHFELNFLKCNEQLKSSSDPNADAFQLNSITGNVLSLEQEAYGLLKAKKKIDAIQSRPFACSECPKSYTSKHGLRAHWAVHRTIENRAKGIIKAQKTRKQNLKKKFLSEQYELTKTLKKSETKKTKRTEIKRRESKPTEIKTRLKGIEISKVLRSTELKIPKKQRNNTQIKKDLKSTEIENELKDRPVAKELRHSIKIKLRNNQIKKELKNNQIKKEGYECTCGKIYQRRSRMETCLRSHNLFETNSNCVSCMTCTKKFKDKDELTLHRKRLHRKKFPCKFCPTDYDTRKELFKHLRIHQKVQLMEYKVISEVMKGKEQLRCFMCSRTWRELSELKTHVMNEHKGPYVCPHCKDTFPKILDFGTHTKTYHPDIEGQSVLDVLEAFSKLIQAWKCEECDLQFLDADKLALHQIEKHSPELKTELQFQCADCRRVFISQKGLTSHRRVHHNTETHEETKVEETGIMCLECRKMCKDMTALTSHMRLHSPERKYPCKFCDFRFATPEKRKAHAEIHTGDMRYVCFICEYQCSSENRLKQHKMSLKHANIKEYLLTGKPLLEEPQSSSQQEKVKDKKELTVKRRKKDKETEKKPDKSSEESVNEEFECDICGDKFPSESEMQEHKQTHPFIEFPNDDKPSRIFFK